MTLKRLLTSLFLLLSLAGAGIYAAVCVGANGARLCGTSCSGAAGACSCTGACTEREYEWVGVKEGLVFELVEDAWEAQ